MTTTKVVRWPNQILRTPCAPVADDDATIPALVEEMREVLREKGGVGLSANQVGVAKRLFITAAGGVFINSRILHHLGVEFSNLEGCLSLPGYFDTIPRFEEVQAEYQDLDGNVTVRVVKGFEAVVFAHEIDHLNGIFFAERSPGGKDRARAWARNHR